MSLESLIRSRLVTPVTPAQVDGLRLETLPAVAVTPVTLVTHKSVNAGLAFEVTCSECRHAIGGEHSSLIDCAQGVESGNPTRRHWKTDRHHCAAWSACESGADQGRSAQKKRPELFEAMP